MFLPLFYSAFLPPSHASSTVELPLLNRYNGICGFSSTVSNAVAAPCLFPLCPPVPPTTPAVFYCSVVLSLDDERNGRIFDRLPVSPLCPLMLIASTLNSFFLRLTWRLIFSFLCEPWNCSSVETNIPSFLFRISFGILHPSFRLRFPLLKITSGTHQRIFPDARANLFFPPPFLFRAGSFPSPQSFFFPFVTYARSPGSRIYRPNSPFIGNAMPLG